MKRFIVFGVFLLFLSACSTTNRTPVARFTISATMTPTSFPVTITPSAILFKLISVLETSSDGMWTVSYITTEHSDGLLFTRQDTNVEWVVDYYTLYGSPHGSGKGTGALDFLFWSDDGIFAYIVPVPEWDGPGLWFGYGATLIRLNMQNGSWEDLNVGSSWSMYENLVLFSADDGVCLRDMTTDAETLYKIPEKYEDFGRYVWSPDGSRAVFTASYGDWYEGENGFSVIMIDFTDDSVTILLEDDLRFLYPTEWESENQILLTMYEQDEYFHFDLTTKKISAAPTPTPEP